MPEARQAVAVDKRYLYAIDNNTIGRYEKRSGKEAGKWQAPTGSNIKHLNSGVVIDGKLYCAHSNYPNTPMTSSIEIWDTQTFSHIGSHSFGHFVGSATWVDYHNQTWWVMFAHYDGKGGEPGKGPEWSSLVKFDNQWRRLAAWSLPKDLLDIFSPYSNSGGAWANDGLLYLTGHNGPWIYAVRIPQAGAELELVRKVPAPIDGQGIAWDNSAEPGTLYGVIRASKEVTRTLIPLSK